MKTRQVTVYHFEPDSDIGPLLSAPAKLVLSKNNSLLIRGNWVQFRDVEVKKDRIEGRLCKVRSVGKPTVGKAFISDERPLHDDVIETCFFLYHKKENCLLMQKNDSVSTSLDSLMSKLLLKIFPKVAGDGLGIKAILHTDILQKIIEGRGSVKKVTVKTVAEQRDYLHKHTGSGLDFSDDGLLDAQYKTLTLAYALEISGLKKSNIEWLASLFKKRRIEDASFVLEGDSTPIKLSEYVKYDKIEVEVNDNDDIIADSMFDRLNEISITKNND